MPRTTRRDHQAGRLQAIGLRYSIHTHLDYQMIATLMAIGVATSLPAVKAIRLLTRRQCQDGDATALQAVVARLSLEVALPDLAFVLSWCGGW